MRRDCRIQRRTYVRTLLEVLGWRPALTPVVLTTLAVAAVAPVLPVDAADLFESGLVLSGEYIGEYSENLDGGVREEGASRHLGVLGVELDLEELFDLNGATVYMQVLGVAAGEGGSRDTGDLQVYSNIENDRDFLAIYEFWYEQKLANDRLRIKVGKVDAGAHFDVVEASGNFASSSAGTSPTVVGFPSYPDSAMSFNLFYDAVVRENGTLTLGYGVYDGASGVDGVSTGSRGPSTFFNDSKSDDLFHIFEAGWKWDGWGALPDGRLAVGGWSHSATFETFDGGEVDGAEGLYLLAEQRLPTSADVWLFAQYGTAPAELSEIEGHFAVGVIAGGFSEKRPDDELGFYLSYAELTDDPEAGFDGDETAVDLYYRAQLTERLAVQPEVHYIAEPSGDPALDDALVASLRAILSF